LNNHSFLQISRECCVYHKEGVKYNRLAEKMRREEIPPMVSVVSGNVKAGMTTRGGIFCGERILLGKPTESYLGILHRGYTRVCMIPSPRR